MSLIEIWGGRARTGTVRIEPFSDLASKECTPLNGETGITATPSSFARRSHLSEEEETIFQVRSYRCSEDHITSLR